MNNTLFAPIDLVEHLSFLVLAVSYFVTTMFWLRVIAVVGLSLEIIYFSFTRQSLATGLPWDAIFVLINLYQIILLVQQRAQAKLPPEHADMLRRAFDGLDDPQIAKLLRAADWREVNAGDVITRQDAPVDALYFMLHGRAKVEVDNKVVAQIGDGAFIGEIAYLTGNAATAKVTAEEKGRLLVFSRVRIAKVTAGDKQASGILFQVLGRDLAQKMRAANTRNVLEGELL